MEVFQNGGFSSGEPVYQRAQADGTYEYMYDLMTKDHWWHRSRGGGRDIACLKA